jgi:hypothetical protein
MKNQQVKSQKEIVLKGKINQPQIILRGYSLIRSFIIFGSPARKSNNRIYTGTNFILGKSAQSFIMLFKRQINRIKLDGKPFDRRDYFWTFEIYYNCKSADASIELIFDTMEHNKVITNDVNIRNYIVLAEELDYITPRVKIALYKKED